MDGDPAPATLGWGRQDVEHEPLQAAVRGRRRMHSIEALTLGDDR